MHWKSTLLLSLTLALAGPALATDGVLEINQTCAVQTGCFTGDTAGYPVTITVHGSYRLTGNLVVPDENTDGILVSTSSVSIDLNGFEIVRSGCEGASTSCIPVAGTGSGVTRFGSTNRSISVKNGSVTGMGLYGVYVGQQGEVLNVRSRWNRLDGIVVNNGSRVSENVIYQNGRNGVLSSSAAMITDNVVYLNGEIGIFGSFGAIVTGNTVRSNGTDGLFMSTDATYSENTMTSNGSNAVAGTGVNLGGNYCAGAGVISASCP